MSVSAREDLLSDRITGHFLPNPPDKLAIAVSGGSDSLALLVLLNDWAQQGGPALHAVTVDHRLRPEAAQEAAQVAAICETLGVPHKTLTWSGWDGQGNLPDQARRARYALIGGWARENGLSHVALGHTADDQAETFLMRLAREAGVDGLSAMSSTRRIGSVLFCRPALDTTREDLRAVLRARGMAWIDDPTNEDAAYERVRARQALAALAPLGITAPGLARVAGHMAQVRETLYWYVFLAARNMTGFQSGDLLIDRRGFHTLRDEIARRLLQQALRWVNGAGYAPRGRAVDLLIESIRGGTDMTLQGCLVSVGPYQIRISREYNAVATTSAAPGDVWDGRWHLSGPACPGAVVRALGPQGLGACPDRHETGLPASSLTASPAIWQDETLVAAPLAGLRNGWSADLTRNDEDLFAAILSH